MLVGGWSLPDAQSCHGVGRVEEAAAGCAGAEGRHSLWDQEPEARDPWPGLPQRLAQVLGRTVANMDSGLPEYRAVY